MRYIITIFLFMPIILFSQGWEKTYRYGVGESVKQTIDDGYIIGGWTRFSSDNHDMYLIKTDEFGDTTWTKTYGGENNDFGLAVQQTTDEGFIFTGYTVVEGFDYDVYLVKTDKYGDTMWTKTYGKQYIDIGTSVEQTTDGGYILTGETHYPYPDSYVYLIKTDELGDTLWTKTYGGDKDGSGGSVKQTTDGGYIIVGTIETISPTTDIYIIKTDENGDSLWTKTYGGPYFDFATSVVQTTDDGYVLTGWADSDSTFTELYLIKINDIGDMLWTKTYNDHFSDYGKSVQQTIDGGYIVIGWRNYGSADVYLLKTDSNGDTLWSKSFGDQYENRGCSGHQTTDGGYIISGFTRSDDDYYIVYLIKTDNNGNIVYTSEIPIRYPKRKLIKLIDITGRQITKPLENIPYIEIYNDGTTRKKMIIK